MTIDVESLTGRRNDDRWNRVSVGDIVERMTWNEPDKAALVAAPDAVVDPTYSRVTYSQANDLINKVANALLGLGLARASRVAMLCENSVEAWLTKLGIAKAGMVAAPVNVMMAPDVMTECLERVDAQVMVADGVLWQGLSEQLTQLNFETVVCIIDCAQDTSSASSVAKSFGQFIASASADEPDVKIHGDDIWEILFTSGTTAFPKAAMVSHTSTYLAAYSHMLTLTRGLAHESDIRLASFTPMVYHISDHLCVFGPLVCGGTAIIGRKPDGAAMAQTCTRERATCLFGGSPQFVEAFTKAVHDGGDDYDLASLTMMFFGWAPMAPQALGAFRDACGSHVTVYELIGQTEAVACHRFFIDRHLEIYLREAPLVNHVGKPSPIMAATVFDAQGNDLRGQPGRPGEAVFRSPVMFSGYYKDRPATEQALRGGWFHSGDSFEYGDDGVRLMVDRYKDIVKSGGENVSSIRVETVLQQHPAVARAAVVGLPDERWGEAVTGCVIPAAGAEVDADELMAFARDRLAGYESPKRIVVLADFPTTVGGKVLKYELRAALTEPTSPQANRPIRE